MDRLKELKRQKKEKKLMKNKAIQFISIDDFIIPDWKKQQKKEKGEIYNEKES